MVKRMFADKPIIGLAGGIGSGKSLVAGLLAEMGCAVLDADRHAKECYRDPEVRQALRQWWGDEVFDSSGNVDFKAIGGRVFHDGSQRKRLEELIHPRVAARRTAEMSRLAGDPQVLAFVWDIPLLFEVGLERQCDAVIFVDAPLAQRVSRVAKTRGWGQAELLRRENLQLPLDRKRQIANYRVENTADVGFARSQVQTILSDILARRAKKAR